MKPLTAAFFLLGFLSLAASPSYSETKAPDASPAAPVAGSSATPAGCSARSEYLRSNLSSRLAPTKFLAALLRKGPAVVYFGASHQDEDTNAVALLLDLLHRKDRAFDCFVLEKDARCQADIDAILSGRSSFEQAASAAGKICAFDCAPAKRFYWKPRAATA